MKYLSLYLMLLVTAISSAALAQSVQYGYVYELGEKNQRYPLANVEIVVTNAGSTISDEKGEFKLRFRQLRAGDRVTVRRISKAGYRVFNEDDLEQWYISGDDTHFDIILCRTEMLENRRSQMLSQATNRATYQFEHDQRELSVNYNTQKITAEEYRQKLAQLKRDYEEKLNNIDNYIDRFVRLDMTQLSADEQRIMQLVQVGDYDKAIELYEKQDLTTKLQQQEAIVSKLDKASSDFYRSERELHQQKKQIRQSVFRQADLLRMQGGKEAHNKITHLLHELAMIDTTNVYNMLVYARQLQGMNDYDEALRVYRMLRSSAVQRKDSMTLLRAEGYIATMLQLQGHYTQGMALAEHVLPLYDSLRVTKSDTLNLLRDEAEFCQSLGIHYAMVNNFREAHHYFEKGLRCFRSLRSQSSLRDLDSQFAMFLTQYGTYMRRSEWGHHSMTYISEALQIIEQLYADRPYMFEARLAFTYKNMGIVQFAQQNYPEAEEAYLKAEQYYRKSVERNPDGYIRFLATCLINLGETYIEMQDYMHAFSCLEEAQQILLQTGGNEVYGKQLAEVTYLMGKSSYHLQDYETALRCNLQSVDDMSPLFAAEPELYRHKMAVRFIHVCNTYMALGDFIKAYNFCIRAYELDPEYCEVAERLAQLKQILNK